VKPIAYHPEARLEADVAAAFYHLVNSQASRDFLNLLEKAEAEIQEAPQRWPFERGTSVQRRRMARFPYMVFYSDNLHEVYILAVAHTSRRPGYWKTRIAVD
jgi:toxin ParE1/3/4